MWKPETVVVYSPLADRLVEVLRERFESVRFISCPNDTLLRKHIAEADSYVGFKVPSDVSLKSIKWIHSLGAGVDALLGHPDVTKEMMMTRTIGEMPRAMGEYCLAHLLADCQHVGSYVRQQLEAVWKPHDPSALSERTVLLLGTGRMGTGVAELLSQVGCRVWGVSKSGGQKNPFEKIERIDSYHHLAKDVTDVISTLPLTNETRSFIDFEFFRHFHRILFINVGRGAVVDQDSLRRALDSGHVRKATLDVFPQEPPEPSHWFWQDPRVQITPHVAALTTVDGVLRELLPILDSLSRGSRDFSTVDFGREY